MLFDAAANEADRNGDGFPLGFHEKIPSWICLRGLSETVILNILHQG